MNIIFINERNFNTNYAPLRAKKRKQAWKA